MALKDKWKNAGKNICGAFKNFGKAMATTAKVAVGKEENEVNEDGETALRSAWKKTGKGFGDAGKSIGTAAKGTVDKIDGEEKKHEEEATKTDGAVDVDSKMKDEEK